MIAAVDGVLESHNADSVVVKAGPLSLLLFVSGTTLNQIGAIGERIYLNTHLHLREDNLTLYGFATKGELQIFQKLIMVSGIGPRSALALLTAFEPQRLVSAIISDNLDLISHAPGIGKKMAGRIVLELKGKLEKEGISEFAPVSGEEYSDVVAALVNLGYSLREASQAVSMLPAIGDFRLEDRIKLALQQLASR